MVKVGAWNLGLALDFGDSSPGELWLDLFIYLLCLAYCFTLRAPHSLRIALTVYLVVFMIYGKLYFYIVKISSTEKYFCG